MRAVLLVPALLCLAPASHARGVRFAGNTQTLGLTIPPKRVLPPPKKPGPISPAGLVQANPYSTQKRVLAPVRAK